MSLTELLQALDERNIRYAPTSTRSDLEELLRTSTQLTENERLRRRGGRRQRRRRRKLSAKSTGSSLSQISRRVFSASAKRLLQSRTVQRARRKLFDWRTLDTATGVRDVDYHYSRKDPVRRLEESRARRVNYEPQPRGIPETAYDDALPLLAMPYSFTTPQESSLPSRRKQPERSTVAVHRQRRFQQRLNRQSTQRYSGTSEQTTQQRAKYYYDTPAPLRIPAVRQQRRKRKIYSPYYGTRFTDDGIPRDAFDRVGDCFTSIADQILFGSSADGFVEDSEVAVDVKVHDQRSTEKQQTVTTSSASQSSSRRQRRHWKDRFEERLDYMLGLHDPSNSYLRWADLRRVPKEEPDKTPRPSKPLWEQSGSLLSLLWGKDGPPSSMLPRRRSKQQHGFLLHSFEALFRSIMVMASSACRWASVRGSIPQPVVALGLVTTGLCVPPRRRVPSLIIVVLLVRTVGELIHETFDGDWDDEQGSEEEVAGAVGLPS